MKAVEWIAQ